MINSENENPFEVRKSEHDETMQALSMMMASMPRSLRYGRGSKGTRPHDSKTKRRRAKNKQARNSRRKNRKRK